MAFFHQLFLRKTRRYLPQVLTIVKIQKIKLYFLNKRHRLFIRRCFFVREKNNFCYESEKYSRKSSADMFFE